MLIHAFSLLLLAFAVSLDGFGVGVTYGLRRIRIPLLSISIIAFCSGLVVWLSMQIGSLLSGYMSPMTAKWIGAVLLMLIGAYALIQWWQRRRANAVPQEDEPVETAQDSVMHADDGKATATTIVILELKRLGIVIQILRKPQIADVDRSGAISSSEAILLGFALSLDSFGAGLGAAMVGFNPLLTAIVISTASGIFLLAGMRLGFRFAAWRGMQAMSVLPGVMLIVMGLIRLM
ncbi:sporulation membrane protein YtaF [Paenibacillus sacheonensis]|uniref:Sporulation membrane protein YtaF n=1 Tax=Paenibacillus sacheonensis TaxID=742054 RepID=A0A7X4YJJ6_9BACL|nr:putative sporulation protein YtaF [Paenibacillus sacheonensis]NBC67583.1 sporulation membrane protein YtaF [Paenibacillus sacheonensis]